MVATLCNFLFQSRSLLQAGKNLSFRALRTSSHQSWPTHRHLSEEIPRLHRRTYSSTVYKRTISPHEHQTRTGKLSNTKPKLQGARLLSFLPKPLVPYAELARLDKPAGAYYLFFPCLFSTLLAAPYSASVVLPSQVISTTMLFFAGAMIMRGAGCTINDLWDRNFDRHVERTKNRPIARGAVTPLQGVVFTGFQLIVGLGILLQFPTQCFFYATPSLLLVTVYPLAKRVTHYPQAVLGLTFSWGALMGFPALGLDLIADDVAMSAAAALYFSCWAWTMVYDMIYAHMDVKDDPAAGIKSIALAHEHNTKTVLSVMSAVQVALLGVAGFAAGAGPAFYVGSCGGAAATLATMIWRVRLSDVKNCWWWFIYGCLITGGTISAGLFIDYAQRYRSKESFGQAKRIIKDINMTQA